MNVTGKTVRRVFYVAQGSFAMGIEWDDWKDMGNGADADLYKVIGKAELFHHFMEHGCYPEPFASTAEAKVMLPLMVEIRNDMLAVRKTTTFKFRTRIVKRTVVSQITDEEVDTAMTVKHGDQP